MEQLKNWYDKTYKISLIIPAVFFIFSLIYLTNFNIKTGDLILKDVSLTGGTTITVFDKDVNVNDLQGSLSSRFQDVLVRQLSEFTTGKQKGFFVETQTDVSEVKPALEEYLGYSLTTENSSVEFSGSTTSSGFYQQLRLAVILAFIFMAIVVFIVFRSFVPSITVILAAFADIVMTLAVVDLLGMRLSIAGVIAFLMLIGYSVDTDILLTSRVLKNKEETVNLRIYGAFKTGITMTLTAIAAVAVSLLFLAHISNVFAQIFTILLIGLFFDLINTWITNAAILKWYVESRHKGAA